MSNLSELLPSGGGQNLVEFVASGTLPNGKPVILNSDGTVTVVSQTNISASMGTSVVFKSSEGSNISTTYDTVNQKVVIAYTDNTNGSYGTAVVGTVSGASISFGSAVVFASSSTSYNTIVYDTSAQKIVVSYKGASNYGRSRVGTVSGTSISFGSETIFESNNTNWISSTYDTDAQKVVISYGAPYATYGKAVVGTVSGTSISFGSAVTFESADTRWTSITYDSSNQKVIIAYSDYGNSGKLTAIVGTVAGTAISFGSAVLVSSGSWAEHLSCIYDTTNQKVVIAYTDTGNSSYGTAKVGTVSGTSISFGTAVVFESAAITTIATTYHDSAGKVVIAYLDNGNSGYGTAVVGTVSGTGISFITPVIFNSGGTSNVAATYDSSTQKIVTAYKNQSNDYCKSVVTQVAYAATNLTSTNLIGITSEATSSGGTAKINTWGGINESQTSLTITSDYYAQTDGTITTNTSGQKLGTAISATTINIRDLP